MYIYEKPIAELIDFSMDKIMDGAEIPGTPGSIEEGEGNVGEDF